MLIFAAEDTSSILGTIGIFLSGAGSVLTGWLAIRYESKRGERVCKERIDAFLQGMKTRDEILHTDHEVLKDDEHHTE